LHVPAFFSIANDNTFVDNRALIDAGSRETIEPVISGLAKENEIEPNSQSLAWKVGAIWPGEYYIKISKLDGFVLRSGVFTIKKTPENINIDQREKICKESGGLF